jgi:type II secretory pathway pseudopilin PulG
MASGRATRREAGFTLIAALIAVAVIGVWLAATSEIWSQSRQRSREQELLFVGGEFRQAIALYYQRTPGAAKQYPAKLDDLLLDKRYPTVQRYLRKLYPDPMTGKAEWGLVPAPGGGVMGVYSLSGLTPIKTSGFSGPDRAFEGAVHYSDWRFLYEPAAVLAAKPAPR